MEARINDTLTDLYSHANVVGLESNSFVIKLTGRTCNVQPFSSDLGMTRNALIVDVALACE